MEKACAVYSALSIEKSGQYEVVMLSILKAYELLPEVYWQKFTNTKKTEKQTYVEFGREKETLFVIAGVYPRKSTRIMQTNVN